MSRNAPSGVLRADTKSIMTRWFMRVILRASTPRNSSHWRKQKMVRHAGDVVADDAMPRLALGQFGVMLRHAVRMIQEK